MKLKGAEGRTLEKQDLVLEPQHGHIPSKMKSAYELAMERLEAEEPSVKLTEDQLKELREIDSVYESRIAEKQVLFGKQINDARAAGDPYQAQELSAELNREIARLKEEAVQRKEKIRHG